MADEAIGFSSLFAKRNIAELLAWTSQFEGNKPCQKCCRIKLTNYAFDVA